jgi:hypothetical protein
MDDVLSGLDLKTESELFSRLLGVDGLLRQSNTAAVLVTNAGNCELVPWRIIR